MKKPFKMKRVLLIDDDLRNSFALSRLLQGLGLSVQLAESGRQAIEVLESESPFDLMLLDLMMPEMNGQKVIEQVRGKIEYRMLPIIVLTGSDNQKDEMSCRSAGADDYLLKPVEISVLLGRLKSWLKQ